MLSLNSRFERKKEKKIDPRNSTASARGAPAYGCTLEGSYLSKCIYQRCMRECFRGQVVYGEGGGVPAAGGPYVQVTPVRGGREACTVWGTTSQSGLTSYNQASV